MKMLIRVVLALSVVWMAAPLAASRSETTLLPLFVRAQAQAAQASSAAALPASSDLPKANYQLAAQWRSSKVGKYVFSRAVTPHWLEFSDRFWYSYETPAGENWWVVDPVKKAKTPLWDNAKMAAQLTRILRTPYDAQHLPITQLEFIEQDTKIRFSVRLPRDSKVVNAAGEEILGETQQEQNQVQGGGRRGGGRGNQQQGGGRGRGGQGANANTVQWWLEYEIATGTVTLLDKYKPEEDDPNWANVSPDEKWVVFARGQNLFMMDAENFAKAKAKADDETVVETQLTTDGEEDYGYGRRGRGGNDDQQEEQQQGQRGGGRGRGGTTETEMDKKFGPRSSASGVVWSQDSSKFSAVRQDSRKVKDLWVINALANPRPTLETYKYGMPGEAEQPQTEKGEAAQRWITAAGDKLYFNRTSRDLKRIDIVEADTSTGETRVVIPERSNTYIEIQPLRFLDGGRQLIHWSERDGWGHYYLYNSDGTLVRQITTGEFVCTSIEEIDEKNRVMYVNAAGREPGEDPYFEHLYRVSIDTGEMKLLTPGNASHAASMNDKATFLVDNASTVSSAPVSALYDTLGNRIMDLETTDVSALLEAGFKFPEPFQVKADDGITDIYGTMYKPFDFDPSKKYPIILYVYPGPQTESVTKTFSPTNANVALANTGFIVIEVGNRGGNPARSKWYHNYGYGNLRDYGVPDKKAAVEQLAKRHPWIDLERVGIYGHSGGGFMTAAAMFGYPDFFKVGISESGNHDNSIYNRWWSEKHDGVKEVTDDDGNTTFEYDIDKNQDIAANLKGQLLLITGDIDNNVHPSNTYRVIDALIKANKRFDFILLPGLRHGYTGSTGDYVFWRRVDYFAQHLLGASPNSVDIIEIEREQQIRR
jgi:dipeptidyl-peptidase-4